MIKHTIATLALTLSLASSAVQAQETNCDGWMSECESSAVCRLLIVEIHYRRMGWREV
jgi:hypothetical protein